MGVVAIADDGADVAEAALRLRLEARREEVSPALVSDDGDLRLFLSRPRLPLKLEFNNFPILVFTVCAAAETTSSYSAAVAEAEAAAADDAGGCVIFGLARCTHSSILAAILSNPDKAGGDMD